MQAQQTPADGEGKGYRGCAAGQLQGVLLGVLVWGPGLPGKELPVLKEEGVSGTQPSSPGAFSRLPALLSRKESEERERRHLSTTRPRRGRRPPERPLWPGHPSLQKHGCFSSRPAVRLRPGDWQLPRERRAEEVKGLGSTTDNPSRCQPRWALCP